MGAANNRSNFAGVTLKPMSSGMHRLLLSRWPRYVIVLCAALLIWARWGPMDPLFDAPLSTALIDRDGELLGATVAADGQWRLPPSDSIPRRFAACLIQFEDRRFEQHWGVRLQSLLRAWRQNRAAGRVVSGGSTITMQVARMARGNRPRTVWNKLVEMGLALRLELRMTKSEILALHAGNAPFGSNVVGLEAAAWRWFGKAPHQLGWAESATLAVLPNAPSRIHPGRNRDALRAKRDRLLRRLLEAQLIDSVQWSLAVEEPLPDAPRTLPSLAPHLLSTLQRRHAGQRLRTTIDRDLQQRTIDRAAQYAHALRANEVHNAAVLIMDVATGEVLAYMGNLPDAGAAHAGMVDIVQAPRSTGSLLKPFLYAAMLQAGECMPDQLVADLPTSYEGFAPRNFDMRYSGAVPASQALARSLNVPAVRALREHGVDRTRRMLVSMGLHHLDRSAAHYGLSLIVGGGEGTLWELTGAYASMARTVNRFTGDARALNGAVHAPHVLRSDSLSHGDGTPPLNAAALYHTLVALQQVNRPETEAGWHRFQGAERIAWKTGTSYGHRDAWAIGVSDRYAIGVWTGNASGEGRPGLTGSTAAAPLLFDLFGMLPTGRGFDPPYDALAPMRICQQSGFRAGPECESTEERLVLHEGLRTALCPYHQRIWVNAEGTRRVVSGPEARAVSWFCLPPAMEYYYAPEHPIYRPMPPWSAEAYGTGSAEQRIQMVYPEQGATLYVPVQLHGELGRVVLQAAHRAPGARLHWDLDGDYLGSTIGEHQLTTSIADGEHRLTLTDDSGAHLNVAFRTISSTARP